MANAVGAVMLGVGVLDMAANHLDGPIGQLANYAMKPLTLFAQSVFRLNEIFQPRLRNQGVAQRPPPPLFNPFVDEANGFSNRWNESQLALTRRLQIESEESLRERLAFRLQVLQERRQAIVISRTMRDIRKHNAQIALSQPQLQEYQSKINEVIKVLDDNIEVCQKHINEADKDIANYEQSLKKPSVVVTAADNPTAFFGKNNIPIYQFGVNGGMKINISPTGIISIANEGSGYVTGIANHPGGTRFNLVVNRPNIPAPQQPANKPIKKVQLLEPAPVQLLDEYEPQLTQETQPQLPQQTKPLTPNQEAYKRNTQIISATPLDQIGSIHGQKNLVLFQNGLDFGGRINVSAKGIVSIANMGRGYISGPANLPGGIRFNLIVE